MDNQRILIFQLPRITTESLPSASVGTEYNQLVQVTGGEPPYVCFLSSGTLPPGITLNENCTLTGLPSSAGNYTFTIKVEDSAITDPDKGGFWHKKQFSLNVESATPHITNVVVTTRAIEITFDKPVVNEPLDSFAEIGEETYSAADLRNYIFKTGNPLTVRNLSRFAPYNMITEYDSNTNIMRIYGLESLGLSEGDNWQLEVEANKIKHLTQNEYVPSCQFSGQIISPENDPRLDYIISNEEDSSCYSYPCSVNSNEQVIISGNNFSEDVIVIWGDSVTQTSSDFISLNNNQIITQVPESLAGTGLVDVYLKNTNNNRISQRRKFILGGENKGIVVGRLVLSDGVTSVDKAPVIIEPVYFGGMGSETYSQANGKFALGIDSSDTYKVKFVTPANIQEAAPSEVGKVSVNLGDVVNLGTKQFKTATISGYVKAPAEQGSGVLEGAIVRVYKYDWSIEQKAITGKDGSFRIYVDNSGTSSITLGIEAEPSDYHNYVLNYKPSVSGGYDQVLDPGEIKTDINIYLTQINVTGTIKTPPGNETESNPYPDTVVPYANVCLHTQDWSYEQWTQTDENGIFYFGGAPQGENYILEIEPPYSGEFSSYARTRISGLKIGPEANGYNSETKITNFNYDDQAQNQALRISIPNVFGRVLAGGSPVPNAWVSLYRESLRYETSTDENGKFRFGGVGIGKYTLEVDPGENSSYSRYQGEVEISSETENILEDISLSEPNVKGYVFGPSGSEGQSNVWVEICPSQNPGICYGDNTNNNGYFAIGIVPDGTWRVSLYVDSWSSVFTAPANKTLVISNGIPVSLDGTPVSGDIVLRLVDPSEGGLKGKVCAPGDSLDCEHPQANVGVNLRPLNSTTDFRWSQTNESGEFAFGEVLSGVYEIEIDPWGSSDYARKTYQITINSDNSVLVDETNFENRNIVLFLSSPNIIGHIYSPVLEAGQDSLVNPNPNQPIQRGWVNLFKEGGVEAGNKWYGASTDDNGRFVFGGVKAGTNYILEVEPGWGSVYSRKTYTGITLTDLDNDGLADECSYNGSNDSDPTDGICDLDSLLGTSTNLPDPTKALRVSIPVLRGQIVSPDDKPISNCWVMVYDQSWTNQAGSNTDENGYFRIGGLPDGTYQIEINMPWGTEQAYAAPSGLSVKIQNGVGNILKDGSVLTNNKITLTTPLKTLIGYVYKDVNDNNSFDSGIDTPVFGAKVYANHDMGGGFFETTTDENGKYVLKLSSGSWWVNVSPDWSNVNPDWVYTFPPSKINFASNSNKECKGSVDDCALEDNTATVVGSGLDFKVEETDAIITGYVKLPDGTAVANAWVQANRGHMPGNGDETDSNGKFLIKVPAGNYEVTVSAMTADYGAPNLVKVKALSGQTTNIGTLYLKSRSAHIRGSVTDSTGNAIGGVMINAWQIDGPGWANTFTDSQTGAYDLLVNQGTWGIMVTPMSDKYVYQGGPLEISVKKNEISTNNNFVLQIADTTLKVSVVNSQGERVEDFWGAVWVKDNSANNMIDFGKPMEDMMIKGGLMDEGGEMSDVFGGGMRKEGFQGGVLINGYTEIKIPGGTESSPREYEIGLNCPPGSSYTLKQTKVIQVVSGNDQEVELVVDENNATVQGYLYVDKNNNNSYDSGEEVSGISAFINAHRSNGAWQMTESNSDGFYTLDLSPGSWYVDVWVDPNLSSSSDKYIASEREVSLSITAGETITQNFKLEKLDSSISGKVLDPDGQPMENVWVFVDYGAQALEDINKPHLGLGAFTDAEGNYTLNVPAGTYKIGAGLPPWDTRELINPDLLTVTVGSGQTKTGNNLSFKTASATISGNITLDGELQSCYIRAWSENGGATGTYSADGSYSLNVSANDTWYVSAVTKIDNLLYESDETTVETREGTNTVNLILEAKNVDVPEARTVSFDAATSKTIILSDGLEVNIPAGALASSGTVTVSITPKIQAQPDSKEKPLGIVYDFEATDANGRIISNFNSDIQIIIPYDEDLVQSAGYTENQLRSRYFNETTNTWENWKSVTQDTENNVFIVTTDHFTSGGLTGGRTNEEGSQGEEEGSTSAPPPPSTRYNPPKNLSILINNGDEKTISRTVELTIQAENAKWMMISNEPEFLGREWEDYSETKTWVLSIGDGQKTVYAKFMSKDYTISNIVSDDIFLEEEVVSLPLTEGDLVKTKDSPAVWLIAGGEKHVFPHYSVYHSWGYSPDYSVVKTISPQTLNSYKEGDPVPFRDGSLFRGTTKSLYGKESSAVFFVENGKLRPIKSEKIYQELFNDPEWNFVAWIPDDLLSKFQYPLGEEIDSSDIHPDGSLVKYKDSPTVYLIKDSKKRPFISWDVFVKNGYKKERIITIEKTETYETGEIIDQIESCLVSPFRAAVFDY